MPDSPARALALPPPLKLKHAALFLDIDGTLLDLTQRPEDAVADASLRALLKGLETQTNGALAVLTGRSLADADRVLGGSVASVAALHGQHRRIGSTEPPQDPLDAAWLRAKRVLQRFFAACPLGAEIEDKGGAVAVHYRARPERGDSIARVVDEIANRHHLRALHGKRVSEIMPIGATKGVALKTFMQSPLFAGRIPVAVGDDATDEDAFATANGLGGISILVGERTGSHARFTLPNAAAVRAWLAAAL